MWWNPACTVFLLPGILQSFSDDEILEARGISKRLAHGPWYPM